MTPENRRLLLRIVLTLTALEFFGPAIRDTDASHLLRDQWVGHARVHLAWLLGFMVTSGIVNLWLIWWRKPVVESLGLSALWQSCNLVGFWIAVIGSDHYGGAISVPGVHTHVFGIDENVFAFTILSIVMLGVVTALAGGFVTDEEEASQHVG